MMHHPIYFMHIPRTMGTLLKDQLLYPNFEDKEVALDLRWEDAFNANAVAGLSGAKIVCGHLGVNIASVIKEQMKTITIIRDPIYRSISMYSFCVRVPWHYLYPRTQGKTIIEFARNPITKHVINNAQARHIANDVNFLQLKNMAVGATRSEIDKAFFEMEYWTDENDLFNRAKAKIDSFLFTGVSDRFYSSARLLLDILGIENPNLGRDLSKQFHSRLKSNIYPVREEYDDLAKINQVDLELFLYANRKLDEEIRGKPYDDR